jgi:hypothetical protein
MRIFEKPNLSNNWKCIICDKGDEKPVVLVGICGTEDGGNMQAEQVHVDCLDLFLDKNMSKDTLVIYQLIKKES